MRFSVYKLTWLLLACLLFIGCTNNSTTNTSNTNNTPEFTGEELLFIKNNQIYASNENGLNLINISQNNKTNFSPFWLEKAESVLFVSLEDNYYELWQKNLVTNESVLLWASKKEPELINLSPDRMWLTYIEDSACFLFGIENKTAQRISENCSYVNWAPKEERFVYLEEDKLFLRDFNIKQELSEPQEVFVGEINSPIFTDDKNLIWETSEENEYDLYTYSLASNELESLTDLNFETAQAVSLILSPDSKKVLYIRDDKVWLINLNNKTGKLIITDIYDIIWDTDSEYLYYTKQENEVSSIFKVTKDGLNKQEVVNQAANPIFYHNYNNQNNF